jgi:hypothetical protein
VHVSGSGIWKWNGTPIYIRLAPHQPVEDDDRSHSPRPNLSGLKRLPSSLAAEHACDVRGEKALAISGIRKKNRREAARGSRSGKKTGEKQR